MLMIIAFICRYLHKWYTVTCVHTRHYYVIHTWYSKASNPLKMNSNIVLRFSGLGAVTKMLAYLQGDSRWQQSTNI